MMRTERLILRAWRDEDLPLWAAMNADARVMEHFPKLLDRAESDAMAGRVRESHAQRGFGLMAVEIPGVTAFAGFVGLVGAALRGAFHAVRRDRLAAGPRLLGPGLRHGGRARGDGGWVRASGARRDRGDDGGGQSRARAMSWRSSA